MSFTTPVSHTSVQTTAQALEAKGIKTTIVANKQEALSLIKNTIPQGASVMNGASVTLEQIGYADYLKSGTHPWTNLHAGIAAESDPIKRATLRKNAITSEYYLGSVHALLETGEFVVASNTGSQLPHVAFTSPNLIFVVGTQKIVSNLLNAMKRLEEYVVPLENKHMQSLYGTGTQLNKILIFRGENPILKRNIQFILVEEALGF